MKVAVLGTGAVGRTLAGRLDQLGHDVVVGTRNVEQTLARARHDEAESFAQWQEAHPAVRLLSFPDAGAHGEVVVNATAGINSLPALEAVGAGNLSGKVLLDLALPLDLSHGLPPDFTITGSDSLGERIQRAFSDARVVKALNTVYMDVMVDPSRVPGRHDVFLAGDDAEAKTTVTGILREFGWPEDSILDLGGIRSARGTEGYMQLYFLLVGTLGTFDFNIAIVRP